MNKTNDEKAPESAGNEKVIMRQIIIETDGNNINLVKAEVSGKIELIGILQGLIGFLNQPNQQK